MRRYEQRVLLGICGLILVCGVIAAGMHSSTPVLEDPPGFMGIVYHDARDTWYEAENQPWLRPHGIYELNCHEHGPDHALVGIMWVDGYRIRHQLSLLRPEDMRIDDDLVMSGWCAGLKIVIEHEMGSEIK